MPVLLALLLILVVIALFWVTANVIGVLVYLVIAGLIGALADAVVPGHIPFGWLGAILAGVVGSWLGVWIFNAMGVGAGPVLAGIPIIPALVGAVILAFLLEALMGTSRRRRVL